MSRAIGVAIAVAGVALLLLFLRRPTPPEPSRPPPAPHTGSAGATVAVRAEPGTGASRPIDPPRRRLAIGFGDGPLDVGRRRDPETAAIGPSAIAIGRDGKLLINDPVHGRVLQLDKDGKPLGTIKLPSPTVDDVIALADGSVGVLDRLGEKSVWRIGADGKSRGEYAIEGGGLKEASGTTGLFADPDGGLFVEVGHQTLWRVDGPAGPRQTLPGRPRRDGGIYLRCAIADRKAGIVRLEAVLRDGTPAWTVNLPLGAPVLRIRLVDSDLTGSSYVGAEVGLESSTPPYAIVDQKLVLVAIDPAGQPRGTLALPSKPSPEETFRELTVGDDGTIYRMVITDQGVTIETYRL